MGQRIFELCSNRVSARDNYYEILFLLCKALARYQFNNPLPVGGVTGRERARSSDVLPYLACYYLMAKLDGFISESELRGAVFGLQSMANLPTLEDNIRTHREERKPFSDLASLPANPRTAANLKIYVMSHLSLDWELMIPASTDFYGSTEQVFELTQFGFEIVRSVLDEDWAHWKGSPETAMPVGESYRNIEKYFNDGIGRLIKLPPVGITMTIKQTGKRTADVAIDEYDLEGMKQLSRRAFTEARRQMKVHRRVETARSSALITAAKRLFKTLHKRLYCEVCGFDFQQKYGERGTDYIEAHHKIPISMLTGSVKLTVEDIAIVCSNCHRMLHRQPWITLEDLQKIIIDQATE